MWAPADIYALPSDDDVNRARDAIEQLKAEIDATQRHLDNLRRDLQERQSWLAPVRRLPFEVLAMIFTMSAYESWISPMHFAMVNRRWRQTVLSVPKAWTFIDLKNERAIGHLSLYLQRSGECTFHVGLDRSSGNQEFSAVARMADRTECLSLPSFSMELPQTKFPILERLRLFEYALGDSLPHLNASRFPKLHHLEYSYRRTPDPPDLESLSGFPALSTLRLVVSDHLAISHFLENYGRSLRSLYLIIDAWTDLPQQEFFNLPQLEALTLIDRRKVGGWNVPILITPRLKTLIIRTEYETHSFPLQLNPALLTNIRITGGACPSLSTFTRLKILQLKVPVNPLIRFLEDLLHKPSTWPKLEEIELLLPKELDGSDILTEEIVSEINVRAGRHIQLRVSSDNWHTPLPGIDAACGTRMPCGNMNS